ncbi:MAG TPA: hypothetical protein VFC09_11040 [Candidatus Dormibacteraeota bacterium]|nr:hypothetical protein [Candidatus Dormibacteraeota bacterium]
MGQAVDQARQERDLTRVALAADIDKLERRIRHELDWKARLRRDGPQIIAIAGAVVVVGVGVVVLRARFGKGGAKKGAEEPTPSLDELARQVRELRAELKGKKGGEESRPLWMKLAVRGATAGAAAGASMVARRYAQRAGAEPEHSG